MGISDPSALSDEEYKKAFAEFLYLRQLDRDFYVSILRQVITEVMGNENG